MVDTSIDSESECEDCNGTVVDTAVAKSDTCHEVSNRVKLVIRILSWNLRINREYLFLPTHSFRQFVEQQYFTDTYELSVVVGAGNVVVGAGNVVVGAGNVVVGAGNVVVGAGSVVVGSGNVVCSE